MKELKIIDYPMFNPDEDSRLSDGEVYCYLCEQAKLTYQEAIEETLQIVKSTIGENNNTYQSINNLLINEDKSNNN